MPRMNATTQKAIPHPFQATEASDSRRDNIGQSARGAEAGSATVRGRCVGQPGPGRECSDPSRFAARGGRSAPVTYMPVPVRLGWTLLILPCRHGRSGCATRGMLPPFCPAAFTKELPIRLGWRAGLAPKRDLCVAQGANDGRNHTVDGLTPAFGNSTRQMPECGQCALGPREPPLEKHQQSGSKPAGLFRFASHGLDPDLDLADQELPPVQPGAFLAHHRTLH